MVEDPDEAEMLGRTRNQTKKEQEKEEQEAKHEKKEQYRQKRKKTKQERKINDPSDPKKWPSQSAEEQSAEGREGGGERPNVDQNPARLLGSGEEGWQEPGKGTATVE